MRLMLSSNNNNSNLVKDIVLELSFEKCGIYVVQFSFQLVPKNTFICVARYLYQEEVHDVHRYYL
jgi:hypothetical protein